MVKFSLYVHKGDLKPHFLFYLQIVKMRPDDSALCLLITTIVVLTLVLLDPDIYGFKHILSQIICH